MIFITTRGSAYERGKQEGEQTASLIHAIHARYTSWGLLRSDPSALLRKLDAVCPQVISEMEGLADGSGISKDQIFRMNLMSMSSAPACSIAGFKDANHQVWIAKTDDIREIELGSNILRLDIPTNGPTTLQLHFAGMIWTSTAYSDNGFCMAMTGMPSDAGPANGLPVQLIWRLLSERCATVSEAVAFLKSHPLSSGATSLLLADAQQHLCLVEKNTHDQCIREFQDSREALCHTNHACLGKLHDPPQTLCSLLGLNSRDRLNNLQQSLEHLPRTREDLQSLFAQHNASGAVCQHGGGGLHTDYAVILSPLAKGIWLSKGPPCKKPFEFISMNCNPTDQSITLRSS